MTQLETNMASLALHGDFVACVSGQNVLLYQIGSKEKQVYKIEKQEKVKEASDDAERDEQEETAPPDDHGANDDNRATDDIMAATFSSSGRYFAACDNRKQLALWETGSTWKCLSVRMLTRRCLSLTFKDSEDQIVVADKSGDAYSYSVTSPAEKGTLILGHISMLLDLALCGRQQELLATADRDEKIRVSRLPNGYNVHTFCLGHSEFVTRLKYLKEEDILVSGSGDGTVRLWDYTNGRQLHCTDCKDVLYPQTATSVQTQGQGRQDAGDEGKSQVQGSAQSEAGDQGRADDISKDSQEVPNCDVRCLSFDETRRLLAVGFDRSPTVLVYQLKVGSGSHSLTLAQRIDLGATLWDLTFDCKGNLWTLQAAEGSVARVHRAAADGEQLTVLKPEEVGDADSIEITTQVINANWDEFKGCVALSAKSIYAGLHKPLANFEPIYYERKLKRLAEVGKRKTPADTGTPAGGDGEKQDSETKKIKAAS